MSNETVALIYLVFACIIISFAYAYYEDYRRCSIGGFIFSVILLILSVYYLPKSKGRPIYTIQRIGQLGECEVYMSYYGDKPQVMFDKCGSQISALPALKQ